VKSTYLAVAGRASKRILGEGGLAYTHEHFLQSHHAVAKEPYNAPCSRPPVAFKVRPAVASLKRSDSDK